MRLRGCQELDLSRREQRERAKIRRALPCRLDSHCWRTAHIRNSRIPDYELPQWHRLERHDDNDCSDADVDRTDIADSRGTGCAGRDLYEFVVEERFGFNNQTLGLWCPGRTELALQSLIGIGGVVLSVQLV